MPRMEDMILWPGWETVRLIGRGSYGAVYEIQRDVLGEKEKAALKVITIPQSSSDIDELYGEGYDEASVTRTFQEHLKSIVAEYSLMRKLNGCANVVSCDDVRYVQHEDGIGWDIFIKMELLTPLTKTLELTSSDEQVIRIGTDICRALQLCRRHNIVHRDIKPANIFVSEYGDYKLGDFGIAKTVERTSGGTKIGTYEYMAPEVYHDQPYGAAADIYSLGMVLYWLLNEHRTPFLKLPPALPTNSEKEQARKRRFQGEPLPAPIHGSPALHKVVLKACAFNQMDRYQTPEEMLQDLNALLGAAAPAEPAVTHTPVTDWVENEEPTVGAAASAAPKTERIPAAAPAPEDEEGTVGAFRGARTEKPAAPAQKTERIPVAAPAPEDEEGTVGVFRGTRTEKPAAPAQKTERIPVTAPAPEDEEGTVGVLYRPKTEKAPITDRAPASQPPVPGNPGRKENTVKNTVTEKTETQKQSPKKSKKLPLLIGVLGLVAALAVALLLWQPWASGNRPTSTGSSASTGSSGSSGTESNRPAATAATEEPAHVHTWIDATCTEPRTCKTCGATQGSALGHSWREATYDTPKTCSRCGEQEGDIKGYIGQLDGEFGGPVQVSNIGFYSFELYEPVYNCRQLWLNLYVQGMGANSYGRWYIIARDLNGKWQKIGEVTITEENEDEWVFYEVEMYGTFSFDAITVSPDHSISQDGSVGADFYAQVNVD